MIIMITVTWWYLILLKLRVNFFNFYTKDIGKNNNYLNFIIKLILINVLLIFKLILSFGPESEVKNWKNIVKPKF